jgi:hypothetical protein
MQSYGRLAYEGYCAKTDGRSLFTLEELPGWDAQRADLREAWEAAGKAVADAVLQSKEPAVEKINWEPVEPGRDFLGG